MKRSHDKDHLSPSQWKGELQANTCNLYTCWINSINSVQQAETLLMKYGYDIDFSEHLNNWQTHGVDLLRPRGGKYPGISVEVDQSLRDLEKSYNDLEISTAYTFQSYNGEAAIKAEALLQRTDQPHSIWIELDGGKQGHKKTILHLLMDTSLDIDYNKSHDCLL